MNKCKYESVWRREGGKTWNTQSELKFCHQMCLMRNANKRGSIQDRLERETRKILKNWLIPNSSFRWRCSGIQ